MLYKSNTGGGSPVDFETAILDGFASDGGLYIPEYLPQVTEEQLNKWRGLHYIDLAFEVLSLFIERSVISEVELKKLLHEAYASFEKEEIIPIHKLATRKDTYIMELFHGPTLSFKDIGLAFLINLVNFFLERKDEFLSIIVATTGDTGPATAYFTAGKSNLDAWVLYPKDKITEEQERQMTTLPHPNIHPVGVSNCPDGGDDLDLVIAKLYANAPFKKKLQLSSVNSINWGRIIMQTVHYFYGYLQITRSNDETVHMAVPSGAFGNLCAGSIARKMGLPIKTFVVANNKNACLHRIFSEGRFTKEDLIESASSAIDILIPYNFWRYLYFRTGQDGNKIKSWMDEFKKTGKVLFDKKTHKRYSEGYISYSTTDAATLDVIKELYEEEDYLLDPHGAVAVVAADHFSGPLDKGKVLCLATAHPSKFPESIRQALGRDKLPSAATHPSIEAAKSKCQKVHLCDHAHLESALIHAMESNWDITKGNRL